MSSKSTAAPVAVIGAGPVGKTAALLLARYGLDCLLIERRKEPSDEPKAISIDDEALRVYQTAEILDDILPIIVPGLGTKYFDSESRPLFLAGSSQSGRFGYPFKNPFAQPDLERVLHEAVEANPRITTMFGHELVDLEDDGATVVVRLRTLDGEEKKLHVSYCIGADGGRSTVRSHAQIPMEGRSLPETWIVIDTVEDPHLERYGLHYGTPERPHVIVPGLDGRCRYEFRLFDGEGAAGDVPEFTLIAALLANYRVITPEQVERAVVYTFNGLNAESYHAGRVFLMGDAAHMMPPFAGQGLNSGIRDAMNLCWKIAGVVQGQLSAEVLPTYTVERRPHAGAMVRLSERLGTIVMATHERVARYRDRLVRSALGEPARRAWFEGMKYRPVARYDTGLVSGAGDLRSCVGSQLDQPRAFEVLTGSIGLLDYHLGSGWALIGIDVGARSWSAIERFATERGIRRVHAQLDDRMPRGLDVEAVLIDIDGRLSAALDPSSNAGCFLLVRPDRFVAARWRAAQVPAGVAAVSSWFSAEAAADISPSVAVLT